MKNLPLVNIIILNWNSEALVRDCLISLSKLDYQNYNIIVVDNGSTNNSVDQLKKSFPKVCLMTNNINNGFAQGNNDGIELALKQKADYVLLLNNDTVVEPNFLSELVKVGETNENIGIIGPKIYFYNSMTIWFAGGKLNKRTGFTYHLGEEQEDRGEFERQFSVDFISGCAMLVKADVFKTIGLLDPDYFHSHEDADFCFRAKQAGFSSYYAPKAVVYHKLAVSSGGRRSPFYLYYRTRNHLLFKSKQKMKALFFWPVFCLLVLKRIFGSLVLGQPKGAKATLQGICDFYTKKWGRGSGQQYQ